MHIEPEEANQSTSNERTNDRKVHLPRCVEERNDHVADPGEGHCSARESIEAVGKIHTVTRCDDGDHGDGDPQDWCDRHLTNKGHDERGEGEVLLQIDGRDNRHAGLPEQLLSRRDAITRTRIQPVIKRAKEGNPEECEKDGVGGGVDCIKQQGKGDHDRRKQEPAHGRCPLFDDVPLRAKLTSYALTKSRVLQET